MCGLYGFIGFKKQQVDVVTFLALGVENDIRGGHGCGIFVDGKVEYGSSSDKHFSAFYEKSDLLKDLHSAEILIGHDRKASVGGISDDKLQPVVLYDENKNIDFVLMHNGTISNHTELAKKYLSMSEDESKELTDSQIMARIIYIHGFKVFSEYVGAGVFVMVDYRTPKRKPSVFVFKGKSKEHTYSKEAEEERPLFYVRTDNGLWFSSTSNYLNIFKFATKKELFSFPCNKVLLINENDHLQLVEEIDRSELIQKPTTQITPSIYTVGPDYYDDEYYGYEGYWEYMNQRNTQNIMHSQDAKQSDVNKALVSTPDTNIIQNLMDSGQIEFNARTFRYVDSGSKMPLTGIYYFNEFGQYFSSHSPTHPYKLYLFNGVPVYGENVLTTIIEYCGLQTDCVNFDEMCQYFPELVYAFTNFPYYDFYTTKKYYRFTESGKQLFYNGVIRIPFTKISDTCFEFAEGDLVGSKLQKKQTDKFYKKYKIYCSKDYESALHYLTV